LPYHARKSSARWQYDLFPAELFSLQEFSPARTRSLIRRRGVHGFPNPASFGKLQRRNFKMQYLYLSINGPRKSRRRISAPGKAYRCIPFQGGRRLPQGHGFIDPAQHEICRKNQRLLGSGNIVPHVSSSGCLSTSITSAMELRAIHQERERHYALTYFTGLGVCLPPIKAISPDVWCGNLKVSADQTSARRQQPCTELNLRSFYGLCRSKRGSMNTATLAQHVYGTQAPHHLSRLCAPAGQLSQARGSRNTVLFTFRKSAGVVPARPSWISLYLNNISVNVFLAFRNAGDLRGDSRKGYDLDLFLLSQLPWRLPAGSTIFFIPWLRRPSGTGSTPLTGT